MKLSILIPLYNAETFIARCINSLINQNLSQDDYEIIILNDGSTDNSKNIVESYTQKYQNIHLYNQENKGEGATRNTLFKLAQGDYVYCLDSDDYVLNGVLKQLIDFAVDKNLDILGFQTLKTKNENLSISKIDFKNQVIPVTTGKEFLLSTPNHRVEVWWYFIKRSYLEKNKFSFGKGPFIADVMFTIENFIKAKRVAYLPITIHRYYQSPDSILRCNDITKRKKVLDCYTAMILEFSQLIDSLTAKENPNDKALIQHLKQKRDGFTFVLLFRLIKLKVSTKSFKDVVSSFENSNAYPIKNYVGTKNSSMKFKLLNNTVNHKKILFSYARLYHFYPQKHYVS